MTARDVRPVGGRWPMADRSVLATVLGLPPLGAVGLAAVLTAVGVFVDLMRIGSLGTVFTVCYVAGCVLAAAWVRRSGLFGPLVQPPLLVGVAVPVIVLLAGSPPPGAGVAEQLLVVGAPLVNAFPIMAWTTGIVLVLGLARLLVQRPLTPPPGARSATAGGEAGKKPRRPARDEEPDAGDDERPARAGRRPVSGRRGPAAGAARGEGRTSGSPRRS
jgi:hypothetical protein